MEDVHVHIIIRQRTLWIHPQWQSSQTPLLHWLVIPVPGACIALEYNLVAAILKSLEAIPLRITHKHIKSHQDNEERTNILKLSWEAQLNITMTDLLHTNCTVYVTINSNSVTGQIFANLCLIQLTTPDYKNTFSRNTMGWWHVQHHLLGHRPHYHARVCILCSTTLCK